MMNISMVINQMIVLFVIILIGYIANKLKIMDATTNQRLSKLVVNITLPAFVLSAVAGGERQLSNREVWMLLGIACLTYVILFLLSLAVPFLLHVDRSDAGLYRFMTIFSNVGFMAFPVVNALLGSSAVFYAAIFNIPYNILVFSLGIYLVKQGKDVKINPKMFINPGIIASIVAMALYLLNISLPSVVCNIISNLGQITTPSTMLIIGCNLAMMPLKEVFNEVRLYPLALLKLVLVPMLFWAVFRLFIPNELMLIVTVVVSAMPVATNATLLCEEYGGNHALAAKGVFLTTLVSLVTIPLLMYLLF